MSEPKYYVVQALENPLKKIADYWCVAKDWVEIRGSNDPIVKVSYPLGAAYPLRNPLPTEGQLKKRPYKSGHWSTHLGLVKYRTDSYSDVKRYFRELLNNEENYEDEHSRTSPGIATLSAKNDFMTNVLDSQTT